jgi:hypothetical protein
MTRAALCTFYLLLACAQHPDTRRSTPAVIPQIPSASPERRSTPSPWASRELRSTPSPFLGLPGLTQVTITTRTDGDVWSTSSDQVEVLRNGSVVCEIAASSSGYGCTHTWSNDAEIVLRSRQPLQFDVQTHPDSSDGIAVTPHCTRYELPAEGTCRVVASKECVAACEPSFSVSRRAGTGRVIGSVTRNGEALPSVTIVVVGAGSAISDERGAFDLASPAGNRRLELYYYDKLGETDIRVNPYEDVVVDVMACSCCDP